MYCGKNTLAVLVVGSSHWGDAKKFGIDELQKRINVSKKNVSTPTKPMGRSEGNLKAKPPTLWTDAAVGRVREKQDEGDIMFY